MVKAALTGNFGSGKSLVLGHFARLGAFCMDADAVVAELLREPGVLVRIRGAAGDAVFDSSGALVKARLADLVFTDPCFRKKIEDILHPLVMERIEDVVGRSRAKVAVIEIPLLFEKGLEARFDRSITVFVDERTALGRLASSGVSREEALRRISIQMPVAEKIRRSHYAIKNNGSPDDALAQAEKIYRELLSLSAG